MTYIGKLYDGDQLVRLIPLDGPRPEFSTPRLLPPRLAEIDPAPAAIVTVDVWRWTGESAEGKVTADFWIRTFGTGIPADIDRDTFEIPVLWLRYLLQDI